MLNKVQFKSVVVTSYGIWINKDPYFSHLKIWGYSTYKKRSLSDKLDAKSDKCPFVEYPKEILDISSTKQAHINWLNPKVVIHVDEVLGDPSKTHAHRSTSRIHTIPEKCGFLISEQWDVLLTEVDQPNTYEESLNSSEFDKQPEAMKSEMDSM